MFKHSLYQLINEYNKNKDLLNAYINSETIENYNHSDKILGFTYGMFLIILVIWLFIFTITVFLLVKYWNKLPTWAQIVCLLLLILPIPGGSIISIMIIFIITNGFKK
jgi:hypothetical protein